MTSESGPAADEPVPGEPVNGEAASGRPVSDQPANGEAASGRPASDQPAPGEPQGLVDFAALARQVRSAAATIAAAATFGALAQTVRMGIDPDALLRWLTALVALTLAAGAVLVAWHAYRGAMRVHGRGERLSGDDVGLVPPRPPKPPARRRGSK